jgi:hypothetical protein
VHTFLENYFDVPQFEYFNVFQIDWNYLVAWSERDQSFYTSSIKELGSKIFKDKAVDFSLLYFVVVLEIA